MPLTPSEIGARAEAAVAAALVKAGKHLYVPLFSAHARVDLIMVDETGWHRVQCKTARVEHEALSFRTCSNTGNVPRTYDGEVDFFGVYAPSIDRVFLVPAKDLPTRACYLRLSPPRNNQRKRIRFADDYAIGA
jgi:hypothetical protein